MKTLISSIKITVAFCIILFVGYVMLLWGAGKIISPNYGEAELLTLNGKTVGASNVGQQFTDIKYFWSRPSAVDYNGAGSGGSNKGATNPEYLKEVSARIDTFLIYHPYLSRNGVPSEMVTASASGLDPHISPEAAIVQVKRVAGARGISPKTVIDIMNNNTEHSLCGKEYINVLKLNIALDENTIN